MTARTTRLVAAAAAVLVLAGCAGSGSDEGGTEGDAGRSVSSASGDVDQDASAVAPGAAEEPAADSAGAGQASSGQSGGGIVSVAAATRSIVYRVDLTVQLTDVAAASARATSLAETAGGYVESETTSGDGVQDGPRSATLVLRVPVDRRAAVVTDLSELGTVVFRERSAQDVTEEVVDVTARIGSQRASLARLRDLLDKAGSLADVVTLEREISSREADLDSLLRRQKQLSGLAELATISVTFAQPGVASPVDDPPSRGFLAGLEAGWEAFTAAFAVALTVVGAAVPFVAAGLLVGVPLIAWWRRRRVRPGSEQPPAAGSGAEEGGGDGSDGTAPLPVAPAPQA